jgi:hypothetical protein
MYERALRGYERAWGSEHGSTQICARNLSRIREKSEWRYREGGMTGAK